MKNAQVIPFRFEAREIRTMILDGQPWFVATDVCSVLGYANSRKAISDNCREAGVTASDIRSSGQMRRVTIISEGNLYRLIIKSRKEEAQRFESWICDEVLPEIRKNGRYNDEQGKMATLIGETIGTDGFHMLGALIKGKVSGLPAGNQRKAAAKIWSQTHAAFGVRSAADIPATQLDSARNFIGAYALEGEWLKREEPRPEGIIISERAAYKLETVLYYVQMVRKIWSRHELQEVAQKLKSEPLREVNSFIIELALPFSGLDSDFPAPNARNESSHDWRKHYPGRGEVSRVDGY